MQTLSFWPCLRYGYKLQPVYSFGEDAWVLLSLSRLACSTGTRTAWQAAIPSVRMIHRRCRWKVSIVMFCYRCHSYVSGPMIDDLRMRLTTLPRDFWISASGFSVSHRLLPMSEAAVTAASVSGLGHWYKIGKPNKKDIRSNTKHGKSIVNHSSWGVVGMALTRRTQLWFHGEG